MRPSHIFLRIILLGVSALSVTSCLSSIALAAPTNRVETPPVLSASKLLPAHLLKGPYHTIEERVTSDGYFNNYRIKSKFGVMEVEGRQLLEIRIGELNALAELDKLSSTKVFQDAAAKAGTALVMAPVRIIEKTAKTVSDPQKIVDTISGIPEGAEKVFSWAYRQSKGAVHAIGDLISPSDTPKPGSRATSSSEAASNALDQGAKLGLEFIGYSKFQREWFRKLHVNPYTSNELLRDEIMRVAGIETTVKTAFRFVPGLGLLGPLATFNRWYDRAEKLSLYEDPGAIRKKSQQELAGLGVPEEIITNFLESKAYTPWSRRFITASLAAIGSKVTGHTEFIKAACEATNEPSTLYFVSVAESLEHLHRVSPLKRIVASLYLPAAVTEDGMLYMPLPVDYLFWTDTVSGIFADFRTRVLKEATFSTAHIVARGKVSALARQSLEKMNVRVSEGLE